MMITIKNNKSDVDDNKIDDKDDDDSVININYND